MSERAIQRRQMQVVFSKCGPVNTTKHVKHDLKHHKHPILSSETHNFKTLRTPDFETHDKTHVLKRVKYMHRERMKHSF